MADNVLIRPYLSPTLVLLAFDWSGGRNRDDFLGFAIQRSPGFGRQTKSWLPNRLGFNGPADKDHPDLPTNTSPIQKFMWWDARIDSKDRGKNFEYTVTPVVGSPDNLQLVNDAATTLSIEIPREVERGIGSYFNRAVVSSQAFTREFGQSLKDKTTIDKALRWLANGLDAVIPNFIKESTSLDGAIYHLTDEHWVLPALDDFDGPVSIVYHSHPNDTANANALKELGSKTNIAFAPRTHTNIMHNKFLVRVKEGQPVALLAGSANFTTEGLTSQANLLHTWESPELAALYQSRQEFIATNPALKRTQTEASWSDPITVGDASVRVFFAPEPDTEREALDQIVNAVNTARKSVLFCLFDPTDDDLLQSCFNAADRGLMMFGVVNSIREPKPGARDNAVTHAAVQLFHRSKDNMDVFSHDAFSTGKQPTGFWWETSSIQKAVRAASGSPVGEDGHHFVPEVYIHHKFVVIDAETDQPIIYTGSANLSNNSSHKNDENLLEIRSSPRMARIYLAEFLRLYEHYRARVQFNRKPDGADDTLKLAGTASWAAKYYKIDSPEYRARINMASSST